MSEEDDRDAERLQVAEDALKRLLNRSDHIRHLGRERVWRYSFYDGRGGSIRRTLVKVGGCFLMADADSSGGGPYVTILGAVPEEAEPRPIMATLAFEDIENLAVLFGMEGAAVYRLDQLLTRRPLVLLYETMVEKLDEDIRLAREDHQVEWESRKLQMLQRPGVRELIERLHAYLGMDVVLD